jgi:hypothetical protein
VTAPLPPPTGRHRVARTAFEWTDPYRPERYGGNPRRATTTLVREFLSSPATTSGQR